MQKAYLPQFHNRKQWKVQLWTCLSLCKIWSKSIFVSSFETHKAAKDFVVHSQVEVKANEKN